MSVLFNVQVKKYGWAVGLYPYLAGAGVPARRRERGGGWWVM